MQDVGIHDLGVQELGYSNYDTWDLGTRIQDLGYKI